MATDVSENGWSKWILRARKLRWVNQIKDFFPVRLRQMAWATAASGSHYEVLGSRMFIPPHARNLHLLLDNYEPSVSHTIRAILKPGMSFCDVGANLGVFTLFAAKLVGPTGRVVAFEPVPENAEVLRTNLALNQCRNVTLLQKAVAVKQGRATLHLSSMCGCHSLISKPEGSTARTISVETIPLCELAELADLDLLKIDVEGAELAVLQSLGSYRPRHVILEYNAERTQAAGHTGAQFIDALRDLGYSKIEPLEEVEGGLESITAGHCVSTNLHAFV